MNWYLVFTLLFIVVSVTMVLIILVQRPSGGGLAGAFGGAGGAGTDTVFGGRVGDALTWATVVAFVLYLTFAVMLNRVQSGPAAPVGATPAAAAPIDDGTPPDDGGIPPTGGVPTQTPPPNGGP